MFSSSDTATSVPVVIPAQPPEAIAAQQEGITSLTQPPVVQGLATPELNGANADTTVASEAEAPTPQKQKAKKNSSPSSSKQGKKPTPTQKQSKAPDT